MKLSKNRFKKIINTNTIQTRKKLKKNTKVLNHTNTLRSKTKNKAFNLLNKSLKKWD